MAFWKPSRWPQAKLTRPNVETLLPARCRQRVSRFPNWRGDGPSRRSQLDLIETPRLCAARNGLGGQWAGCENAGQIGPTRNVQVILELNLVGLSSLGAPGDHEVAVRSDAGSNDPNFRRLRRNHVPGTRGGGGHEIKAGVAVRPAALTDVVGLREEGHRIHYASVGREEADG